MRFMEEREKKNQGNRVRCQRTNKSHEVFQKKQLNHNPRLKQEKCGERKKEKTEERKRSKGKR